MRFADEKRDRRGGDKDTDEDALELPEEDLKPCLPRFFPPGGVLPPVSAPAAPLPLFQRGRQNLRRDPA